MVKDQGSLSDNKFATNNKSKEITVYICTSSPKRRGFSQDNVMLLLLRVPTLTERG